MPGDALTQPPVTSGERWSLRRRLNVVLVSIGVLTIVLVALSALLLVQVRSHQRQVINRYFTALNLSTQQFVAQVDAETAIRGYALTGDPATLQPVATFRSAGYRQQYADIRRLVAGDAATEAALTRWHDAAETWYVQWGIPTSNDVRKHGRDMLTNRQVLAGKALFDANRALYSTYNAQLLAKRNDASSALKLRTTLLFVAVLVLAAAVAAAGVVLWLALRSWVLRPLEALGGETRVVRSGDFGHEVRVRGPDEIQSLGRAVDEMRGRIVVQLRDIQTAREEIEAQAEELSRSNRDLEQFAYVASHDLQEPLRKVASFCQMLERRYKGQLDERADQYIEFAVDGAKRMQRLINDLLAFSRVGRLTEDFSPVDLQQSYDTALTNLTAAIESTGADVSADPLPTVNGAGTLLVQLFQNLIGNAIKFHGEQPPKVHIGVRQDGDFWEFCCADNGIGIEPQYAERIFIIFQRLHGKDEYTGTGIGLAMCKRIVEHHGGRIWLDTTAPHGTTFRWTLPVDTRAMEETS